MLFSVDTIEKSKNNPFPTLEDTEVDYDISFFETGLDINLEVYKEFCDLIFEQEIVGQKKDSIKPVDPTEALKAILTWFNSSYKKLAAKYDTYMEDYSKQVSLFKKYEDKLKNCMDFVRYSKEYYTFVNLEIDTSKTTFRNEINNQIKVLEDRLLTIATTCHDKGSIDGYITRLNRELADTEFQFDVLRGRITKNGEVKKENFSNAVYNFYRQTDSSIDKEQRKPGYVKNVEAIRIQQAAQSFFNLQNQRNLIKVEVDKCDRFINELCKKIDSYNYLQYVNNDTTEVYNAVIRDSIFKIKEICELYIMMFGGRLDAFKQFNKINRDIIELRVKDIEKEDE